jgi:predicted hotdog family 3-hydroxylacyl-ACP dehydratase
VPSCRVRDFYFAALALGYKFYLYPMSFEIQSAADFIPHRPPFVLVDKLLFVDGKTSRCSFAIPEGNLFADDGFYSTAGLVESMAQSAAAGTGYLYRKDHRPVPLGYIGVVQKLQVFDWPPVNTEILMIINLITNILQLSLVSGVVQYKGKILATCEMKIFVSGQP